MVVGFARRDAAFPLHEERHADAAFQQFALHAAAGIVFRGVLAVLESSVRLLARLAGRAAVVAEEKDERVLLQFCLAQFGEHATHVLIQRGHHAQQGAPVQIGDVGKLRQMLRLGLHRPVRRHKGDIEEERLALVPLDEGCRLASEGIGGVCFLPHRLGAAIQIADEAGLLVRERHAAVRMPEGLVKAALIGPPIFAIAQMPFAHQSRHIPRRLQAIRHRPLAEWQPAFLGLVIGLITEAILIPTRHQARTRRAALRRRDVTRGAAHAIGRQRIHVRRDDLLRTLATEVRIPEVVREEDDDVWLPRFGGVQRGQRREQ